MIQKLSPWALASLLALGLFALPSSSASAGSMQQPVTDEIIHQNVLLHNAGLEIRWDRRRHGDRFRYRRGGYDHFYDGYYYSSPWWEETAPLAVYDDDAGWGDDHTEWCLNRYRSYNPDNNTWVSYSGDVRECISPFD